MSRAGRKLVRRVKVGAKTFRVYEVPDVDAALGEAPAKDRSSEVTLGAMLYDPGEILIRSGRPLGETASTLVHELLHAVRPEIADDAIISAMERDLTPALMAFGLRWKRP